VRALLVALALVVGCGGPPAAAVREAREARYALASDQVMAVVRLELEDDYDVDESRSSDNTVVTFERKFRDGVPFVVADRTVSGTPVATEFLRLRVTVISTPADARQVEILAAVRTRYPGVRWEFGDPDLPDWAREEIDAMQLRIHRSLESASR
jgi:hypothetical protein